MSYRDRAVAFAWILWHKTAVPVWLERFVLVVLAAAFGGVVILNTLRLDSIQRIGLGLAIVGLSIFIAQTIHLFNQSKIPLPLPPVSTTRPPNPPIAENKHAQKPHAALRQKPHKSEQPQLHEDWLTETQKKAVERVLEERIQDKAEVRLVCIGPIPKYADQIAEAFNAAGWPLDRLNIASAFGVGFSEPVYLLAPNTEAAPVRAVASALEAARIEAPLHVGMESMGPASLGVPAVTIVIQGKL